MTRSLPTAPNLEHLKKQAKDLRKSHGNGNPECCEVLKLLHQFNGLSNDEILNSAVSLNKVQLALAIDYGFTSWGDLKKHVLGRTDNLKYLHIHCGDASAQPLRNSSIPGDVHVWREIYVEGPVPGNVSDEEFRKVRAHFLSNSMNLDITYEGVLQGSNARYRMLAEAGKYDEVILWFDSCMFDQTIMIHLIDLCSRQKWADTKLSLICIDRGLGELSMEELVALMDICHEITQEEVNLAHNAWEAFTAADPKAVETILKGDCAALPYLKDALFRHLEQYPSVRNGLNRIQNQILQAVVDGAPKLGQIFKVVSDMEERPFLGDTSLWSNIDELAEKKVPLLKLDGPGRLADHINPDPELYDSPSLKDLRRWDISITDAGAAVLAGKQDFIQLNGIDRYLGGVYLLGPEAQWRWDEKKRSLVRSDEPLAELQIKSTDKNTDRKANMNILGIELNPDGHKFDSFSQIVKATEDLLGVEGQYDDICALSTIAFAPTIDLGESCTAWWNMVKDPSINIVSEATGLQVDKLLIPKGQNPKWTDEQFIGHKKECASIIQDAIEEGKIIITDGGWSNPPDKPFAPWCFWGIITKADKNGDIIGICLNNRDDNEIKWLGDCWTVSVGKTSSITLDANILMLQNALARIRSDREPYLPKSYLVYGIEAMDKWIEQMNKRPYCPDCFASAPDREWTCANSTAVPVYEGAKTVSAYLKKQIPEFPRKIQPELLSIIQHYDNITELLESALKPDAPSHYKEIIGNKEKQKMHAETVLLPVKDEFVKAADAIEKALVLME